MSSFVCGAPSGGCSLDSRNLQRAPGEIGSSGSLSGISGSDGNASEPSGSAGRAGSPATGGSGGAAGGGVDEPPFVGGCADLDRNGTGDCNETILKNADFIGDVSDWMAETDTTLEWDERDAWAGDVTSGSALVSSIGVIDPNNDNSVLRSASQCVAVDGMQLVTVYVNTFVEPGQDPTGRAQVVVFFFDGPGCTGAFTNSFTTPQPLNIDGVGKWLELKAGSVAGVGTKSMLVKLGLARAYRAESFSARFDNVLVKTQPP
ncbi:MAG: hypothetical protein WDO74_31845 [Pseudomonadota bacterium]